MSWLVVTQLDDDYDLFSNYIINYLGFLFIISRNIIDLAFFDFVLFFLASCRINIIVRINVIFI
jgi:hypothetical protein